MPRELKISVGQHSDKGRKETNQDFHGVLIPKEPLLSLKGIAIVLADGISSSERQPDRERVDGQGLPDRLLLHVGILVGEDLGAARDRGDQLLAAFADAAQPALLRQGQGLRLHPERDGHQGARPRTSFMSATSRIYRVAGNALEQLTDDHRVVVSSEQSYLSRALGINPQIEIDYRMLQVEAGDVFVLATDGVYEHVGAALHRQGRSATARTIWTRPPERSSRRPTGNGSADNLTVQIVRIDEVPDGRGERAVRAGVGAAAAAAAGSANGVRRLPDRPGGARQQPQPHLSGGRYRRPTRWSS